MVLFILAFLLSASPASAAMTCDVKSVSTPGQFVECVADAYNPQVADIDGALSTSDPLSRYQWSLRMALEGVPYDDLFADAPRDVKVAVIDIYAGHQGHPDLVGVYEPGINTIEGGTNTNPPVWDGKPGTNSTSHGQCAASLIAAEHNGIGMAGMFHRARIIPVRASPGTLAAAINAARFQGAEVIHIAGVSLMTLDDVDKIEYAWPDVPWSGLSVPLHPMYQNPTVARAMVERFKAIDDAINDATEAGVIISAPLANWNGRTATLYWASNKNVLTTGAVNALGEVSPFNASIYGTVLLAGGGERRDTSLTVPVPNSVMPADGPTSNFDDVLCAIGPDKYSFASGGSFAAPQGAAAAAIIKSYLPDAKAYDVMRLLKATLQPLPRENLHLMNSVGGMLSLKRLREAIAAEM
ncbi:hypothetical protein [Microcystis phage Mae-JY35]